MVIENQTLRVATGVLNEIMSEAVAMQQPPSDKGKRLKLYYITQVAVKPPTFVIFVNDKELMHFSYTRYLENKIREAFGFKGTSLKFFIRERKEKDQLVMERIVCLVIGYIFGLFQTGYLYGKCTSCRYPQTGKRQRRNNECTPHNGLESRSGDIFR